MTQSAPSCQPAEGCLPDAAASAAAGDAPAPAATAPPASAKAWVDKYSYTGYEIHWLNAIFIIIFHAVTVVLLLTTVWFTSWPTIFWAVLLGQVSGFGVTGGAHRFWTHRSYKANLPLRIILMLCFCLAGQNSIYDWVRDHRVHHKFSETDADPHNVARGFFFAHVGWLMKRKHPEVRRRGQQVDMSDIMADPVARFQRKHHTLLKLLCCLVVPAAIPVYCWGERWFYSFCIAGLTRYMFSLHFTWLVNSAAHMFGTKPYDRRIAPTENLLVSILALGEGWHNYHHVFPWDYRTSEWGYVNVTMHVINFFARCGWAYDLKRAPQSLIKSVAEKYGDGTHPDWGAPEVPEEALTKPEVVKKMPPGPQHPREDELQKVKAELQKPKAA